MQHLYVSVFGIEGIFLVIYCKVIQFSALKSNNSSQDKQWRKLYFSVQMIMPEYCFLICVTTWVKNRQASTQWPFSQLN